MDKASARAALVAQRAATVARLGDLDVSAWDEACLPGWTVRDVAAHLVAVDEAVVRGRLLPALWVIRHRDAFARWNEDAVGRRRDDEPEALLEALARWGERLVVLVSALPAPLARVAVQGPQGRNPLLYLAYRRVLDEWVHEWDVAAVTDTAEPVPSPEIADVLGPVVLRALPHLTLPRVPRRVGVVRLVVDPYPPQGDAPPVGRVLWSVDFARRHYGPRVAAAPDATVTTTGATLALVQEQRLDWRAAGVRLVVEGDAGLAADLLDALPATSEQGRAPVDPLLY